ncbi:carbohydrate-binding protein [Catellatospora coxensis]
MAPGRPGRPLPGRIAQYWGTSTSDADLSAAVSKGAKVVMSPANKAYLDMKYTNQTPLGLTWAGLIEVQTAYNWDPATLLPGVPAGAILGVEAPLWSETITKLADIEFMAFPRLPALAELAWSPQSARNWDTFKTRLGAQGPRWTAQGINFYRSPQVPWVTPPATGRVEAEAYTSQSGVQIVADANAHGGNRVGYIENGDWIGFSGASPAGKTGFTARVSSGGNGGTIQIRTGSATGALLGTATVANTGGWGNYTDITTTITTGSGPLYLVFTGTGSLFDVDSFALTGTAPPATRVEAESYTSQFGVQIVADANAHGGNRVGYIENGDWIGFSGVNPTGKTGFTARVSSGGNGGTIQIRTGSATGPLLGTATVANTGGWGNYTDITTTITTGSGPCTSSSPAPAACSTSTASPSPAPPEPIAARQRVTRPTARVTRCRVRIQDGPGAPSYDGPCP